VVVFMSERRKTMGRPSPCANYATVVRLEARTAKRSCGWKELRRWTAGEVERQGQSSVAAITMAVPASLARRGESEGEGERECNRERAMR
jgi:hypothetical protein